jgi:hypothetical protein
LAPPAALHRLGRLDMLCRSNTRLHWLPALLPAGGRGDGWLAECCSRSSTR